VSDAGTDLTWACGEYPVMTQWGYADEPGHFDHWGAGHIHTFPNEGSATGTVVIQPGDIVILPYCRFVTDPVRLEVREGHVTNVEGGLDAKLMRDWLDDGKEGESDRDPYAVSHVGWGMNPQARWYWMGLNGAEPERNRAAARVFPGNFLFSTGPNWQSDHTRPLRRAHARLHGHARRAHGHRPRPHRRSANDRGARAALDRLSGEIDEIVSPICTDRIFRCRCK
jgi:2,5-dihydroxypyridine 5,6-dioxygenase